MAPYRFLISVKNKSCISGGIVGQSCPKLFPSDPSRKVSMSAIDAAPLRNCADPKYSNKNTKPLIFCTAQKKEFLFFRGWLMGDQNSEFLGSKSVTAFFSQWPHMAPNEKTETDISIIFRPASLCRLSIPFANATVEE